MKKHAFVLAVILIPWSAFAQTWKAISPMHFERQELAGVTLPDRRVLVAGGNDGNSALSSCELYDPRTDTWVTTGSMAEGRYRFPMVLLKDGRVLAAGGLTDMDRATTDGCEIYDPATGTWQSMNPMADRRENFPALVLPDGSVFLDGGLDANVATYLSSCEIFDPRSNTYKQLASMPTPYFAQIAFYDSIHNQILVNGGSNNGLSGQYWPTTQAYDIASDSWAIGSPSNVPHGASTYTRTLDGGLLCMGGRTSSYVANDVIEVLQPPYLNWTLLGHLTSPRWHGAVVLVKSDSILMIGGDNDPGVGTNVYDSTNWFVYGSNQTIQGPRLITRRSLFVTNVSRLVDPENPCRNSVVVYVFGGHSSAGVLSTCEALALGPESNTAYVQSNNTQLTGSLCTGISDTLKIFNPRCDTLRVDSIRIAGPNAVSVSAVLIGSKRIKPFDSASASVALTANGPGDYSVRVLFFYHQGAQLDSLSTIISFTLSQPPATLSASILSGSGTVCTPATKSILFRNPACDSAVIDSVRMGGADGKAFVATFPASIAARDSSFVTFALPVDTARDYSGTARIYYHIGLHRDSLAASLAFSVGGSSSRTAHAVINDVLDARPGDTIGVPLWIAGANNIAASGYSIHLLYNTDLLQIISPDYTGSLTASAPFDDPKEIPGVGADLYVPSSVMVNTGKLLTLRFRTFLSDSDCTEMRMISLIFSPDDPKFAECVLAANLDSASICVRAICGDGEYRMLWSGHAPQIDRIEARDGKLQIYYSNASLPRFDLYDVMGRMQPFFSVETTPRKATLDISALPSGMYFLRMSANGTNLSRRFVVHR